MNRRLVPALSAIALMISLPAAAQDFSSIGTQYMDFGSSMMSVGQMNNVLGSTVQRGGRARSTTARPVPGASLSAQQRNAAAANTRYRPSPAVSTRVRGQFADFVAKRDPTNGERLRQAVQQKDLLGAWEKHVAVDGLRRGDVADAMTAYWVQNWQIANNVPFANRAQVQGVRGQVSQALGSNPAFARLDDAGKQEMAEVFMLNFVAQGSAFSDANAKKNTTLSRQLSEAAVARFRNEMSIDLRQLKLTEAGFVR
ncbi:DUF6683 family protein [Caulobacter radicis]|uniref:Uncharacterized protein n=1 Tax=Caulobacter radicis TaxID=2172650 RepID=A0A2T9IWB9_9CAUL|nr:DUF6683 family protein [Caulobacter radicis]PVM71262.1 hypothetical protein DDF65_23775 [Caulobacter radicis]